MRLASTRQLAALSFVGGIATAAEAPERAVQAEDLYAAIASYQGRERRFGRVGKGVQPLETLQA